MTGVVMAPVIPPAMPAGRPGGSSVLATHRRLLPVARLAPPRARSTVYGIAAVDCNGRVAENTVMRALGWVAGTRLGIRECGGLVLVSADRHGVFRLTGQGHLRLPAAVRHWCGLTAGDRVLLAADPERGLLVHPPAAVDAMIRHFHASLLGDEPA